tara:strand:- start:65 stop:583 length:519 start_codon:yes stop_codon:yes gene_type:complete
MSSLDRGINFTPTNKKAYYNSNIYNNNGFDLSDFFNNSFKTYNKTEYNNEKDTIISNLNVNGNDKVNIQFGESENSVSGGGNLQDNETIDRLSKYKNISTDKKMYDKKLDHLNKQSNSQYIIISIIILLFIITILLSYLYFFTYMVSDMTFILYFIFIFILCFIYKFILTKN